MRVSEVMTREVITTRPEASIHEAAELMVRHRISGLAVVDERGSVVGVLSEGDLILRHRERERLPWWRAFFEDGERLAREYQKAVGTTVGEVMTRGAICVSPDLPVQSAAVILDERRIRRLPVVADGRLVGVVSRGDLVKALATVAAPAEARRPSDLDLVREMRRRMASEPWTSTHGIVVDAGDGILALWGVVASETEKSALETMARAVAGATRVESHLTVRSEVPYLYWV